jgi:hypothetical protein
MRGRCNHATSLHSKNGTGEIIRPDEENDSAPQSVVERRRQGTQSAFESSNTSCEDRQNDEADRRCAQAQNGDSRYWPRPRSVAFRRQSQPSLDRRFRSRFSGRRVWDIRNLKVMPSPSNGPPTDSAPNRAQRSMLRPILAPDRRARAPALSRPSSRSTDRGGASRPEF